MNQEVFRQIGLAQCHGFPQHEYMVLSALLQPEIKKSPWLLQWNAWCVLEGVSGQDVTVACLGCGSVCRVGGLDVEVVI